MRNDRLLLKPFYLFKNPIVHLNLKCIGKHCLKSISCLCRNPRRQLSDGKPTHVHSTVPIFGILIPCWQAKPMKSYRKMSPQLCWQMFPWCVKIFSWLYGDFGCQLYAAVGFYFGIGVIFSLGLIILDSYVLTFSKKSFLVERTIGIKERNF